MALKRIDYTERAVRAAHSVLLELGHILGQYRDDIVVIGGWVPELLIPHSHTGSMDVDLALNHKNLTDVKYESIHNILIDRAYYQEEDKTFTYYRDVEIDGETIRVQVDLLSSEYDGTGKSHRHQKFQGIMARKVRGCDFAFESCCEVPIEGQLPSGGKDSRTIKVAGIVPFLVMKGMALNDRLKEKDAWDIYYCLKNYPGGIDALAAQFSPFRHYGIALEGFSAIRNSFASPEHFGPISVAIFEGLIDGEEKEIIVRDSYERVQALLKKIGYIS